MSETQTVSAEIEPEKLPHPRIIAAANQKGGVGKTTTVVSLAACLAETGIKTLLIDLDPQGNATSGLGIDKAEGMSCYRPLLGETSILDVIRPTLFKNLSVVGSELDLTGAEVDVARMDGYLHCLQRALEPLRNERTFEFILMDCPPSLGILTMNALTAADALLVPIQSEYYALEGLSVITRLVNQLRDGGVNPQLELNGILLTMCDARTNLAAQVEEEVRGHFPDKVYQTVIPRNIRLSEAPSHGIPINEYDRHSTGARAYRAFTNEFLKRNGIKRSVPEPEARKIPLFKISAPSNA